MLVLGWFFVFFLTCLQGVTERPVRLHLALCSVLDTESGIRDTFSSPHLGGGVTLSSSEFPEKSRGI